MRRLFIDFILLLFCICAAGCQQHGATAYSDGTACIATTLPTPTKKPPAGLAGVYFVNFSQDKRIMETAYNYLAETLYYKDYLNLFTDTEQHLQDTLCSMTENRQLQCTLFLAQKNDTVSLFECVVRINAITNREGTLTYGNKFLSIGLALENEHYIIQYTSWNIPVGRYQKSWKITDTTLVLTSGFPGTPEVSIPSPQELPYYQAAVEKLLRQGYAYSENSSFLLARSLYTVYLRSFTSFSPTRSGFMEDAAGNRYLLQFKKNYQNADSVYCDLLAFSQLHGFDAAAMEQQFAAVKNNSAFIFTCDTGRN